MMVWWRDVYATEGGMGHNHFINNDIYFYIYFSIYISNYIYFCIWFYISIDDYILLTRPQNSNVVYVIIIPPKVGWGP